jgi:hypothetical protein
VPGQTLNADLCFVPASQALPAPLPAVSGSSGRLVVAASPTDQQSSHPGQVFAEPDLAYEQAMQAFVATSPPRIPLSAPAASLLAPEPAVQKRALRQEAERLRVERRAVRQQRQAEDALWRQLWQQHCSPPPAQEPPAPASTRLPTELWRTLRQQRRATLRQRADDDAAWRVARQKLRDQRHPPRHNETGSLFWC